jgi:hypothetical protein
VNDKVEIEDIKGNNYILEDLTPNSSYEVKSLFERKSVFQEIDGYLLRIRRIANTQSNAEHCK